MQAGRAVGIDLQGKNGDACNACLEKGVGEPFEERGAEQSQGSGGLGSTPRLPLRWPTWTMFAALSSA